MLFLYILYICIYLYFTGTNYYLIDFSSREMSLLQKFFMVSPTYVEFPAEAQIYQNIRVITEIEMWKSKCFLIFRSI